MTTSATAASLPKREDRVREAKKGTAAAAFGTFIEYYDFSVFGYVAATIAVVFFPSEDSTAGLLNTFLIFGSAFAVRPLGAWFFGRLGDRRGRRTSLVASIGLMSIAAALTGFLPGYAQIGVWAPLLLVVLRMLQGFSTGGEIGGASSFIREWAPPEKRTLYISFVPSIAVLGKALAAGLAALSATLVPAEAMDSWGWRIPFFLAVPLGLACLLLRLKLDDSPEFTKAAEREALTRSPLGEVMSEHWQRLTKVFTIALVQNVGTYVGTVFVAAYFSSILGYSKKQSSTIVLIAVLAAAAVIPFAGRLGNRIGGRRLLMWSYLAYIVVTIPSFMLMNHKSVGLAIVGLLLGMIPYSLCQAGTYGSIPEFFPVRVRHTGVAFGHSAGAVLGGAGGPYVATWLINATGNTMIPAFILVGFGLLGLVVVGATVRRNDDTEAHLYT